MTICLIIYSFVFGATFLINLVACFVSEKYEGLNAVQMVYYL